MKSKNSQCITTFEEAPWALTYWRVTAVRTDGVYWAAYFEVFGHQGEREEGARNAECNRGSLPFTRSVKA